MIMSLTNMPLSLEEKKAMRDILKSIDSISTYVEEVNWAGKSGVIPMLDELYDEVESFLEKTSKKPS